MVEAEIETAKQPTTTDIVHHVACAYCVIDGDLKVALCGSPIEPDGMAPPGQKMDGIPCAVCFSGPRLRCSHCGRTIKTEVSA